MTRTTDPDPKPFQPLGAPIRKPAAPAPATRPTETPGIVKDRDGRLRTALPLPKGFI